jgi:hypothetical protein
MLEPRQALTATPYSLQTRGVYVDDLGNVGIGTTAPVAELHVAGQAAFGAGTRDFRIREVSPSDPEGWSEFIAYEGIGIGSSTGGNRRMVMFTDGYPDHPIFTAASSTDAITWHPRLAVLGGGNVGIGTSHPSGLLHLASLGAINLLIEADTDNAGESENARIVLSQDGGYVIGRIGYRADENDLEIMQEYDDELHLGTNNIDRVTIRRDGRVGIGTTSPQALLDVAGEARVHVITITGGADIAEGFDVTSHNDVKPRPGLVVSIDPKRIGQLQVAGRAYDRRVAGIISGANGVNPGLLLGQEQSVASGEFPVANVGRVWCYCDADVGGPIVAGDLLTTSSTPGHAMKVTQHDRAGGATLGKAMSSLESGQGLVLVLVSLQ